MKLSDILPECFQDKEKSAKLEYRFWLIMLFACIGIIPLLIIRDHAYTAAGIMAFNVWLVWHVHLKKKKPKDN